MLSNEEHFIIMKKYFKRKSITHIGDCILSNDLKILPLPFISFKELKEINPIIQTKLNNDKPAIIINMKNYNIENKKNGDKLLKKVIY